MIPVVNTLHSRFKYPQSALPALVPCQLEKNLAMKDTCQAVRVATANAQHPIVVCRIYAPGIGPPLLCPQLCWYAFVVISPSRHAHEGGRDVPGSSQCSWTRPLGPKGPEALATLSQLEISFMNEFGHI